MTDYISPLRTALADRYRVVRELGVGGMATVYLARDLKHDRDVAIKVLKPELGAVLGVERFLSEIKVTANLQHPNLLPLFDSGEAAGLLFYVMPFVDGETLRARLDREKQLPIDETLRITAALAAALQYAHERGVIHRDLKPENILLQAGQPVIADFGIALAVSNAGGTRVTQTGLSLGTPQYMSPEQATGDRAIDARTDVYSLAAMTYEMLAGEPPHAGTTAQAIIAKLMTEEPRPVSVLRKSVPPHVDAAIARALEKLPADRLPSAAAFAAAVSGDKPVAPTTAQRAAAASASRPRWREGIAWIAAAGALGAALWPRGEKAPVAPVAGRFEVAFPDSLELAPLQDGPRMVLSHDGRVLVVVAKASNGRTALWMRSADDPTFSLIPGTTGASWPSLSPDGRAVLFADERGAVRRLFLAGGEPVTVYTRQSVSGIAATRSAASSSWGADDRILIDGPSGSVVLVSASGGEPRTVIAGDSSDSGRRLFRQPNWLPGGTHALVTVLHYSSATAYGAAGLDSAIIGVLDVAAGTVRSLGIDGVTPQYVEPGYLLFSTRNALSVKAVPFAVSKRAVSGTATVILENVRQGGGGAVNLDVAVADNGWLVAVLNRTAAPPKQVVLVDGAGRERAIGEEGRAWRDPRISPDSRRLILQEVAAGTTYQRGDLWVMDLATGAGSRLTTDGGSHRPSWSRDGRMVYFLRWEAKRLVAVWRRPWDGSGREELVYAPTVAAGAVGDFEPGPDNGLSAIRNLGARDIFLAPTESLSALRPLVTGPSNETKPALSPDGRWIAYQSDESGQMEIYLRPVPGPGARLSVSTRGAVQPRWSPDGRRLFYRSQQALMAATLEFRDGTAVVARRDSLFADTFSKDGDGAMYDVRPDGAGFVFLRAPEEAKPRITLIPNWPALLRSSGI